MYIQSCLLGSIYVLGFLSCDRNSIQTILSEKGIYWLPVEKVTGLTEKIQGHSSRMRTKGLTLLDSFHFASRLSLNALRMSVLGLLLQTASSTWGRVYFSQHLCLSSRERFWLANLLSSDVRYLINQV